MSQFTNFLPVLIGVALGYLISMLFKVEPIYEKNLDMFIEEEKLYENVKKERISLTVQPHSKADGEKVRAIIWPTNGLVVEVTKPDGSVIVPDGEYVFSAGDRLIFECETDDVDELYSYMYGIVGKPEE